LETDGLHELVKQQLVVTLIFDNQDSIFGLAGL